jgi:hypothetical protein
MVPARRPPMSPQTKSGSVASEAFDAATLRALLFLRPDQQNSGQPLQALPSFQLRQHFSFFFFFFFWLIWSLSEGKSA